MRCGLPFYLRLDMHRIAVTLLCLFLTGYRAFAAPKEVPPEYSPEVRALFAAVENPEYFGLLALANELLSSARTPAELREALALVSDPMLGPASDVDKNAERCGSLYLSRVRWETLFPSKAKLAENFDLIRSGAESGNAFDQIAMGIASFYGINLRRDRAAALTWFEKASAQGNRIAVTNIGIVLSAPEASEVEKARAIEFFRSSAASGDAIAKIELGWAYYLGLGLDRDPQEALRWWAEAYEAFILGLNPFGVEPMIMLGVAAQQGVGMPRDEVLAYRRFADAAGRSVDHVSRMRDNAFLRVMPNQSSCEIPGHIDLEHLKLGVKTVAPESIDYFGPSNTELLPLVAAGLAQVAALGLEAQKLSYDEVQRAADQGDPYAQFSLAQSYYEGRRAVYDAALPSIQLSHKRMSGEDDLVEVSFESARFLGWKEFHQDSSRAVHWWRAAAEQGHPLAQTYLGTAFYSGTVVDEDSAQARLWWRRAAAQGEPHAALKVAAMLALGIESEQDGLDSATWCELSAGLDWGCQFCSEAISRLPEEKRVESSQRAADFQRKTWKEVLESEKAGSPAN